MEHRRKPISKVFIGAALLLALLGALTLTPPPAGAVGKAIGIATGGESGVYYAAGNALCRLIQRGRLEHGVSCSVEPTSGSVFNINAIRAGKMDIGIAQSDWQYHAYNGTGPFAGKGKFKELRSLFSLHSESFTVVARKDAGIKTFDDLRGRKVNIGEPGSGARATLERVLAKKGWTAANFGTATELPNDALVSALCGKKIDAFVQAIGHPSSLIEEAASACGIILVAPEAEVVRALVKENPYYVAETIPAGTYAGMDQELKTFGVKATFVTSEKLDPDVAYVVVKSLFENFKDFKTLHAVFANLGKKRMVHEGLTAPLHEGAARYYREAGLLP